MIIPSAAVPVAIALVRCESKDLNLIAPFLDQRKAEHRTKDEPQDLDSRGDDQASATGIFQGSYHLQLAVTS